MGGIIASSVEFVCRVKEGLCHYLNTILLLLRKVGSARLGVSD